MLPNYFLFILLLIIIFKLVITELSDHFQYADLSDTGDLINITDNYNLSILVSTSKKIYAGFPPTIRTTIISTITQFSSGITINENNILMSCLDGKILTKININTGEEIELCPSLSFSNPPQKICSISSYDNKIYLIYTELDNGALIPNIIEFTISNLNDPICENYDTTKKLPTLEPITFDNQIACEVISPINENDFHLVCFYVKKEVIEENTIYKIYGNVEQKEYYIFSSNIETDIKVQKIDSNTIRCINKKEIIDIHLKKENEEIIIYNSENAYSNNFDLYSYNNGFIFASSNSKLRIYKDSNYYYYEFSKSSNKVKKILGIYNKMHNYLLFFYQSDNSINYISLQNFTKFFNIKINSYKYLMKYETSYDFDYSKFISPKDDYGNIEYYSWGNSGGGSIGSISFYSFSDSSTILNVYADPRNNMAFIFTFELISETNEFEIKLQPPFNVTFAMKECLYTCDACFYNYESCDIVNCQKEYSFFRNMDETDKTNCAPNNQSIKNYIYNEETNYFEECFQTCSFCSLNKSFSSSINQNCLVCSDGYQKSYEYMGNCYKNDINDNSDKIIINKEDESFTTVNSCQETSKHYKINNTGECISDCPTISLYKKYTFQYVDYLNYDYDPTIPLYIIEEEMPPKYLFGNLCLEKCPLGTELNEDNNECVCKDSSLQDEETKLICNSMNSNIDSTIIINLDSTINGNSGMNEIDSCISINKRFYLHDIKQCIENGCPEGYYQFNFDCYSDGCPQNTYEISNKNCKSSFDYCYIELNFTSICSNEPINEYIYNFNNTNQYLKSCDESLIYTIKKEKTYLYNNICYLSCPENTQEDEENMKCICKYYKYYLNNDLYNYICFSEKEKCKQYIPVLDSKICLNSINDCIELGYKIFNNECFSQDCPINTGLKEVQHCFCLYYFYNDSNSYNCFSNEETCESKNYKYSNLHSKECFSSIEDCISKGYNYIYMNYCYKDSCPENTEIDETISISIYKICISNLPYFKYDIENYVDFCTIYELMDKSCIINYKTGHYLGNISKNVESIIYDDSFLQNEQKIILGNNIVYEITTSNFDINQRNNYNLSFIDFSECENILKKYYGIDYLLIFKYDVQVNKSFPIIVEYKVYNPKTKQQLDLSICNGNKIIISAPLVLDNYSLDLYNNFSEKGIDVFNKDDLFYRDICKTFTTNVSTDIILSDRRKVYYQDNKYFCENGCEYLSYDIKNQYVKCNCEIKNYFDDRIEKSYFNFENDKLTSFFSIKTYANIACLKCYHLLFNKDGFIYNFGNFLILFALLLFIILMILFYSKFESNIKNLISQILPIMNKTLNKNIIENDLLSGKNNVNLNKKNKIVKKKKIKKKKKKIKMKIGKKIEDTTFKKENSIDKLNLKNKENNKNINNNDINYKISILKTNNDENEDILNDEELNNLEYGKAKIIDKRNFSEYYLSLLKKKHILLFSFIPMNDYNLMHIKICLFLYIFSLYFAANALFFSDSTMHKIYQDKGNFNLLYQLPKILYSAIISLSLNFLIKLFALSEKNILMLKESKTKEELEQKSQQTLACLKLKFNLFYIFGTIFIIIFWYYVAVFCAVYKNTQVILIEDTLLSILSSLLYPFALNLIPSFMRILSIKFENFPILYNISKIASLF